jgi:hypothetical protein
MQMLLCIPELWAICGNRECVAGLRGRTFCAEQQLCFEGGAPVRFHQRPVGDTRRGGGFERRNSIRGKRECAGSWVPILDYRGYGKSSGRPGEQGLFRDSEAGFMYLLGKGYRAEQITVHGQSLGTAVAFACLSFSCMAIAMRWSRPGAGAEDRHRLQAFYESFSNPHS